MINEYLFLSNEKRSEVEKYKPDGITIEIFNIENSPLWIAAYSLESNSLESAGRLSDVHTVLMQYSPLVLTCESSEHYNKKLFPMINVLERKLRKLLYLAVCISENKEAKESIDKLEEKDFGQIFELLFIDPNFIKNLKKRINADKNSDFNGMDKFSKDEIKDYLAELEEQPLWDTIFSEFDVPTLRSQFRNVQTYRNDVMHAHNIVKRTFEQAEKLFKEINEEIDKAIGNLLGQSEEVILPQRKNINSEISMALTAMEETKLINGDDITSALEAEKKSPQLLRLLQNIEIISNAINNLEIMSELPAINRFQE